MELIAVILLVLLVLFGEVGLYRRRGLEGLSYYCHFSETERTEGESLQFVETVTNDKTLPVPWLKAELTTSRWLDFPEANSAVTGENRFVSSFFSVRSRSRVSRVWEITCEKRGVYEMEHIVLVTSDLLGVVRLSLHTADHGEKLTVLPKRLTEAGLLLPKLLRQRQPSKKQQRPPLPNKKQRPQQPRLLRRAAEAEIPCTSRTRARNTTVTDAGT